MRYWYGNKDSSRVSLFYDVISGLITMIQKTMVIGSRFLHKIC